MEEVNDGDIRAQLVGIIVEHTAIRSLPGFEGFAHTWANELLEFKTDMDNNPGACAENSKLIVSVYTSTYSLANVVRIMQECLTLLFGSIIRVPEVSFMFNWEMMQFVPEVALPLVSENMRLKLIITRPTWYGRDYNVLLQAIPRHGP